MTTTLAARVVDGIRRQILSGELGPGAKLPSEAALVAEFEVSRTVVREAVSRLQAEGLVETFQGRGSFVLAVPEPSSFRLEESAIRSHRDVLAMIDFRIGVEGEAAALAAGARTEDAAARIREAVEVFGRARPAEMVEADFAFHRAVAEASRNRFYLELLDALGPMMIMLPRTRLGEEYSLSDARHVERVRQEHDAVAAAVLAGEPETARAAMRVHLAATRRRLVPG
ncbi:FadR/GntR family transcriptional regulator [Desertihabitans aurantiacus]|uniref:FadR/GntR family transcriptional regulator n=1 Tax=Desertihabitans aurantiacus TaxID=2282477 RepID=UPI000DF813AE|nr:FadR/GntR family transcriptional regulator [Desertihabitans aurantiacus]